MSRVSSNKILEFQKKLGLDPNENSFDEQDVIDIISAFQITFEEELRILNTVLKTKDLIFTFLHTDLMNMVM